MMTTANHKSGKPSFAAHRKAAVAMAGSAAAVTALGGGLLLAASRPTAAQQEAAGAAKAPAAPVAPPKAAEVAVLPTLHAICVGAGTFTDPAVQGIPAASADAQAVGDAVAAQKGRGLYGDIDLSVLTGKEATLANIRQSLADLRARMRAGDAAVLYLCGYSGGDASARERFLPADMRTKDYNGSTLLLSEIRETLVALPGHALIVLDLSHGNPVSALGPITSPNMPIVRAREYVPDLGLNSSDLPSNVSLLYAAKAHERSVESLPGKTVGAFATAVSEALAQGKAASDPSGAATAGDICSYVEARVPEIAGGAQHPWNPLLPIDYEDFPLAAPGPHPAGTSREITRTVDAANVSPLLSKNLGQGHVPDIDDLTPHTRAVERMGLIARDPSGQPQSASDWMNFGMKSMKGESYAAATDAFRHAAALYRQKGLPEDAQIWDTYAERTETRLGLFYERPTGGHSGALPQSLYTGQRLEPFYGAYVGAFIDHETQIGGELHDEDQSTGRIHHDVAEFEQKIGKKHAAFFTYCGYKSGFPDKWFENLKENGAAAQWAIEPNSLDEIQDDEWLRTVARAAADAGVPVFVRFASEMNGGWTPYHTPPALYRQKFQLVARVFHQIAPNVAMVWCPNEIPQTNIADYYPGDDYVDWVGVNFYSVYYNDGDASKSVSWRNPADKLQYVYQHYAARHPIMICEWAATHLEKADGVDRQAFAAQKIAELYSSLPRRYPRIKAVFWLDMNAIEYADDPAKRKNDYSLLGAPTVASAYTKMVSSPYFLDHVARDPVVADVQVAPLDEKTTLSGNVKLSAYVKTYEDAPTVVWSVNGKQAQTVSDPGAYDWTLNTSTLPNGPAKITATILDSKGRVAGKQTTTVTILNDGSAPPAPTPAPPTPVVVVPHPTDPNVPPVPVPIKPVTSTTSLGAALTHAHADPNTLTLTMTPPDGRVVLNGPGLEGGVRVTATVGTGTGIGTGSAVASPTIVLLLLHRPNGETGAAAINDSTVSVLSPIDGSDDALAAMAGTPGTSISVPRNERRVLKPDTAGSYTVRAVLLPTKEAARALIQALTGAGDPTYQFAADYLRTETLPGGTGLVIADRTVVVVGGK